MLIHRDIQWNAKPLPKQMWEWLAYGAREALGEALVMQECKTMAKGSKHLEGCLEQTNLMKGVLEYAKGYHDTSY